MDPVPELLVEGLTFPESGRWHEGRLWFSDIDEGRVKAVGAPGRCETMVEAPGFISGLGWAPNGDLWIVGATEHKLFRWDGSRLDELADLSGLRQVLYNDMAVSAEGNAYIGTISFDFLSEAEPKPAPLVLVRPDGSACVAAEGLDFPNGMVITPDGKTLICGETYGARYTAFEIEEDGSLENRRVWAAVPGERPDGCCLDHEGGIWFASPGAGGVVRVLEEGEITDRIAVHNTNAYACMLGGVDRKTLFILCADTHERPKTSEIRSGKIFTVRVQVSGAGLP
jgi:sugar lactone lactonase YvrE